MIKGTESSKELFEKMSNENFKHSLMVTGSADQIFEVVKNGAEVINAFDINSLAEYGLYLKVAAIEALNYNEFLAFFGYTKDSDNLFSNFLYARIRQLLALNHRAYWDAVFKLFPSHIILFYLFDAEIHNYSILSDISIYQREDYNIIKENLKRIRKLTFVNCDLMDIANTSLLKEKYDFIYLSNILYFIDYSNLEYAQFLAQNIVPALNADGNILVHYLYGEYNKEKVTSKNFEEKVASTIRRKIFLETLALETGLNVRELVLKRSTYGVSHGDADIALVLKRKK